MEVLVVNQSEVRELYPMREAIAVMADALKALSRGDTILPLRPIMWLPEKVGALGMMPAYMGDLGVMGVKVVSVFPGNEGTEYDSHQGAVLLFETKHGRLLAVVDAAEITAIRTAAVTAVATDLLSRKDASDLAVLGSGIQAGAHLEAMMLVRKIKRIRLWSIDQEGAGKLAERSGKKFGITVEIMSTVEETVKGAHIICTTTASPSPILFGEHLHAGTHINAIGSSVPFARELDTAAVAKSRLFVDRRESTLNEAGDFLFAKQEGAIGDDHILGEVGEVLLGLVGRRTSEDITLFKSLGLAIEDVASANYIYRKALEKKTGTILEFGGNRLRE